MWLLRNKVLEVWLVKARSHQSRAGLLIQYDWCPHKRRNLGTATHRGRVPWEGGRGAQAMLLQAKEHQRSPATTRSWERRMEYIIPYKGDLQKELPNPPHTLILDFWLLEPWEQVLGLCSPNLWYLRLYPFKCLSSCFCQVGIVHTVRANAERKPSQVV